MSSSTEGARRLGLFVGVLCAFLWLFVVLFSGGLFSLGGLDELVVVIAILLVCFLAGWGVIRGVAWVVRGFQKDREE
jgi:hypothetical protein